jgi:hypothetical protein
MMKFKRHNNSPRAGEHTGDDWVYALPSLHLFVCLISYVGLFVPSLQDFGILFPFILLADLPISIFAYAFGWKYPAVAVMWTFIAGTLWWYLLSRGAKALISRFASGKQSLLDLRNLR